MWGIAHALRQRVAEMMRNLRRDCAYKLWRAERDMQSLTASVSGDDPRVELSEQVKRLAEAAEQLRQLREDLDLQVRQSLDAVDKPLAENAEGTPKTEG
jgi:hypothetical protein